MALNRFKLLSDKQKKALAVGAVILSGIIFVILASLPGEKVKKQEVSRLDLFISETERRLEETVSDISGAGKATVFITTENTFETVYASNASVDEGPDSKTTEKSLAYSQDSSYSSKKPVVVKELCPDIKGVLIVCPGGANPQTRAEIISAVSVALGISQTKIYVTGGTNP